MERRVKYHVENVLNRRSLQRLVHKHPVIIVGDPSIKSLSGLPALDFMPDAIRHHKKFKMGKTKEAAMSRMLKMNINEFTSYTTSLQRSTEFRENPQEKSESLSKVTF